MIKPSTFRYVKTSTEFIRLAVWYSLRHNMKDWLMSAGVPERDEHRILGHSLEGVGNRVFGGGEAKLRASTTAMEKALEVAEEWLKGR
jgi:hypothetical protein